MIRKSKFNVFIVGLILAGLVLASYLIATDGLRQGVILLVLGPLVVFLIYAFRKPDLLIFAMICMGFLISLLSRYFPGVPYGLSIDGLIVILLIALIFHKDARFERDTLYNWVSMALLIWLVFCAFEILNPLAKSKVAWFYAVRGLAFYPIFLVVLSQYVVRSYTSLKYFLILWAFWSFLGTLWGLKQFWLGVSATEQAWLDAGAASTHVLFGKLRIFSFYSDAAQFGAAQAHAGVVFGIIALFPGKLRYRIPLLILAVLSLYGMLISGTRGALGILALGGFSYFVMSKKFKVVIVGILVAVGFFVFLKYTTLMQSNYQINRLRTALRADDPSLMVRKQREQILKNYLADKPLGGGIGSAGYWGKRFSPGTLLAELGTDGHYTRIWMETGIIGLLLYIAVLVAIIIYLGYRLWVMEISFLRQILVAFYCGFLGLCLSSYTNGLMTQVPTGVVLFISLGVTVAGVQGKVSGGG